MVESLAARLAVYLKSLDEEGPARIDVMRYALINLLSNFFILSIAILIGSTLHRVLETVSVIAALFTLRTFSGGFHAASTDKCIILSVSILVLSSIVETSNSVTMFIGFISFLLVFLKAPSNIDAALTESEKIKYKAASCAIVAFNLFVLESPCIAAAFLMQSLSLLNFKGR